MATKRNTKAESLPSQVAAQLTSAVRRNGRRARTVRGGTAAAVQADANGPSDGEADDRPEDDELAELSDEVIETTAEFVDEDSAGIGPLPALGQSQALARLDPLQAYMREVQRHPLLTPDEEHELAVKYAGTGDVEIAARLVTANLRLVVKLAYEYRRAYRNMMDLIQEGNIGLMQAVKRYDPYRGVKLSSYSAWWIRAYMLRFILNNWRLVKVGTTQAQRKLFFNLSKEKARLSVMGIEPTHAEIAQRLNVEEKEVVEMDRRLSRSDASLDAAVGDEDNKPTTRLELLAAPGQGPDVLAERAELGQLLYQKLSEFRDTLTEKDVVIFDRRMATDEPLTLQELGDDFGVSRERVRQLEARLYTKLRGFLEDSMGDAVELGG
ncbi:RNA polymerase factor sigma-32 [Myxococcota bacterium]